MTNLKPRLRLIDLNELEELMNNAFAAARSHEFFLLKGIVDKTSDPSKTKELLSEVYDRKSGLAISDNTLEGFDKKHQEEKGEYLNNLII